MDTTIVMNLPSGGSRTSPRELRSAQPPTAGRLASTGSTSSFTRVAWSPPAVVEISVALSSNMPQPRRAQDNEARTHDSARDEVRSLLFIVVRLYLRRRLIDASNRRSPLLWNLHSPRLAFHGFRRLLVARSDPTPCSNSTRCRRRRCRSTYTA